MRSCWKCREAIKEMSVHHINGNHNDSRSFNLINLCPQCHNVIQAVCDKCDNLLNCHVKRFRECWYFDSGLPPIYFRPKRVDWDGTQIDLRAFQRPRKPIYDCRCMINLYGKDLKLVCLLFKVKSRQSFPCHYFEDSGCTLEFSKAI